MGCFCPVPPRYQPIAAVKSSARTPAWCTDARGHFPWHSPCATGTLLRPEGIHIAALIPHQNPCWKGQHLRICSPKGCQPRGTQLGCEAVSWGRGSEEGSSPRGRAQHGWEAADGRSSAAAAVLLCLILSSSGRRKGSHLHQLWRREMPPSAVLLCTASLEALEARSPGPIPCLEPLQQSPGVAAKAGETFLLSAPSQTSARHGRAHLPLHGRAASCAVVFFSSNSSSTQPCRASPFPPPPSVSKVGHRESWRARIREPRPPGFC